MTDEMLSKIKVLGTNIFITGASGTHRFNFGKGDIRL